MRLLQTLIVFLWLGGMQLFSNDSLSLHVLPDSISNCIDKEAREIKKSKQGKPKKLKLSTYKQHLRKP